MIPAIYDDNIGIIIQVNLNNEIALGIKLSDEEAQEMVDIIQNKLNARLGF